MKSKNRSIKYEFLIIVVFTTFFPFLISLSFLWLILKGSYDKIDELNSQIQHTQELEMLDSFHKSMGQVYNAIQSPEMSDYFTSTSETESFNQAKLQKYLQTLYPLLPFKNSTWIIFGSQGNILFSMGKNKDENNYELKNMKGAYYYKNIDEIILSLPLYYNSQNPLDHYKKIYAYVALDIPIQSIKDNFKYLNKINYIPPDLSALKFKTEFNLPKKNNTFIYLFFFYVLVFLIFNLFAVYFGIKILQNKIILKLKLLTFRVTNEIESSYNIKEVNLIESNINNNEIDSLSNTFYKYIKYITFLQREIEKSSQLAAVGNIAHYLAHDLRKPFSHTSLFVEQLEQINSLEEIKSLSQFYKPLLKNSIQYVEHLLKEIMDAGVTRLQILNSISNIILPNKTYDIELEYKINIRKKLKVDEFRMIRIFINLISNAIEAMSYKGRIWFHANEKMDTRTIEIIVGNNNSYISPKDLTDLFEPFFTKNKKNGTGLGLSIAQKIIELHNGDIQCNSSEEKGVEFILTLPMGEIEYAPDLSLLPTHLNAGLHLTSSHQKEEKTDQKKDENNPKKRILIIDDDIFIGRSWKRITRDADVHSYLSPEDFFEEIGSEHPWLTAETIIISDFYFGTYSKVDFYDFATELRKIYQGPLFLSTDASEENLDCQFLKKQNIIYIKKSIYSYAQLFSHININISPK